MRKRVRTEAEWIEVYQQKKALFIHDNNPLLTSGMHSNGFFFSQPVTEDRVLREEAAHDLVMTFFQNTGSEMVLVDKVVGPATGATKLAEEIAREISRRRGSPCGWAPLSKSERDGKKVMIFEDPMYTVEPGDDVLLVEDVFTTGGSADLASEAIEKAGGSLLVPLLLLVNRSGLSTHCEFELMSLIARGMPTYSPEACPLCALGSKAVSPKDNWAELTRAY